MLCRPDPFPDSPTSSRLILDPGNKLMACLFGPWAEGTSRLGPPISLADVWLQISVCILPIQTKKNMIRKGERKREERKCTSSSEIFLVGILSGSVTFHDWLTLV